jgi:hypothetical protein
MKKPVKRATLLEEVLADLMEAEDILASLEPANALEPLTAKQVHLYNGTLAALRVLVCDLINDVAQEHRAA